MHACMHTYIHAYTHTHIHTYTHRTYTHNAYTHTHIHTYIHTYTHTYITCIQKLAGSASVPFSYQSSSDGCEALRSVFIISNRKISN